MWKRNLAAAAAAVLSLSVLMTAPSTAAPAKSRGCVTLHEYRTAHAGWSKARVQRHFGTSGHFKARYDGGLAKRYPGCANGPLRVVVRFAEPGYAPRFQLEHKRLVYRSEGWA